MNLYKFIKILNIFIISTFSFIVFSIIINLTLNIEPGFILYIITLINGALYYFLSQRQYSSKAIFAISNIAYFIMLFVYFKGNKGYAYEIIAVLQTLMLLRTEEGNPSRGYFKDKFKIIYIILGGIVIFLLWMDRSYDYLYSYLFLSIIIGQVLLYRAARSFEYKVPTKNFIRNNLVVMGIVVFLGSPWVYEFIKVVFKYGLIIFAYMATMITKFIILLFGKQLESVFIKINNINIKTSSDTIQPPNDIDRNVAQQVIQSWIAKPIEILFLIIIAFLAIYILMRFLKRIQLQKVYSEQFEYMEREKIKKSDFNKKQFRDNRQDFYGERGKIFKVFYNIERELYKRGKFKFHMSATQMMNTAKPHIDNVESFEEIVKYYNEAKFSSKEVSRERSKEVIKNFRKIEKEIKNIK